MFTAEKIDSTGDSTQLRLLPRPLYRYKSSEVLDGAIFVFVEGTDPELVFLLEARKHNDETKWHFASGRLNHLRLQLHYRGHKAWDFDPLVPYPAFPK